MVRYVLTKLFSKKGSIILCLCTMAGTLFSYISPYINGKFIDFLLSNKDEASVVWFAIVVSAVGIGSVVLSYCAGTISVRINANVTFSILRDMVLCYERKDYQDLRSIDSSYMTQRFFSDSASITSFVLANFIKTPFSILALPVIFIIIFGISPLFAVAAAIFLTLYCAVVVGLRKTLYRVSFEKKEAESSFYALISSQLGQILNLKLFSRYEQSAHELKSGFDVYFPKAYEYGKLSYSLSSIDGIFSVVVQALVLVVSGINIIRGTMTLGDFVIVNTYFSVLFGILKGFMNLFKAYQDSKASWTRICEARESGYLAANAGTLRPSSLRSVEVNNLTYLAGGKAFQPKSNDGLIFANFSYTFEGPNVYCVIGGNGCGKTSLLYLLLGIYDSRDRILYDGIPIGSHEIDHVRGRIISACPQDLFRPDSTVGDLLNYLGTTLYCTESNDPIAAECPTIVAGVSSLLSKRCESLSGGEIRKVYLYSALSKKSPLLVLDEPTTGIDMSSKNEFLNYINRNPFSQLIILSSHDEDIINSVDYVVRLGVDA